MQIFGRLSGSSAVGSALVSPYESPAAAAKAILEAEETTRGGEAKLWSVKEWLELQQPSLLLRRPLRAGTKKSERQLQSWEQLFSRPRGFEKEAPHQLYAKNPGLLFEEFCERTQGLNFEWPCTMNTGQAPLNIRVVPGEAAAQASQSLYQTSETIKAWMVLLCSASGIVLQSRMRSS